MDTNSKAGAVSKRRGAYRHHRLALKRSIVEETLKPGASVVRIAHQRFAIHRKYRAGDRSAPGASATGAGGPWKAESEAETAREEPGSGI